MPADYMAWKEAIAEEALFRGAVLLEEPSQAAFTMAKDYTIIDYQAIGNARQTRRGMLTGDTDNYIGGLMDALEGICWSNDRHLWQVSGRVV